MKKKDILKSIETYRELYDSLITNRALPNEVILNTYFSFSNNKYTINIKKFEALPEPLRKFYESKGL